VRWVVWLGVLYEFIVFCILLCDGVLDVCGYVHSYPFVGHSDVYGATKDAGVSGCMEVNETYLMQSMFLCILYAARDFPLYSTATATDRSLLHKAKVRN